MHACVCSNHPISPPVILQSCHLSLHCMFALLHCTFRITRDKHLHAAYEANKTCMFIPCSLNSS